MMRENNNQINRLKPLALPHKKQVDIGFSKYQVGEMFHKDKKMIIEVEAIVNERTHISC